MVIMEKGNIKIIWRVLLFILMKLWDFKKKNTKHQTNKQTKKQRRDVGSMV